MAEFPSLPLFTDAYIADTMHLTNEEHGVYLRLLMFAWRSKDCSLPNDDKRIALMLGVTLGKWAKLKPVIMAFWVVSEKGWEQERLSFERARVAKMLEQKADAGKASARAKYRKTRNSHAADVPTGSITAEQQPDQDPDPYIKDGGGDVGASEDFPVSTGKPEAEETPPPEHRERLLSAMGVDPVSGLTGRGGCRLGTRADMAHAERWAGLGLDPEEQIAVVAEVMARKTDGPPSSFRFFDRAMERLAGAKSAAPLAPKAQVPGTAQPPPARVKFDLAALLAKHPELDR